MIRWQFALVLSLVIVSQAAGADAPPMPPPASNWAPADQLVSIIEEYVKSMQESVADEKAFEIGEPRLRKEANTLACLALTLGMHDADSPLKSSAGALYAAAQQAAKVANLQEAQAAVAQVAAVINDKPTEGPGLKWEPAGSLAQLMKQVTFIDARLKRGVRPGPRFESQADQSAKYATVLAVIGQAVAADTHEVKDPAQVGQWYKLCGDMRDAAGEAGVALRARDPEKTAAAMKKLEQSCTDCHNAFRVEITQ